MAFITTLPTSLCAYRLTDRDKRSTSPVTPPPRVAPVTYGLRSCGIRPRDIIITADGRSQLQVPAGRAASFGLCCLCRSQPQRRSIRFRIGGCRSLWCQTASLWISASARNEDMFNSVKHSFSVTHENKLTSNQLLCLGAAPRSYSRPTAVVAQQIVAWLVRCPN